MLTAFVTVFSTPPAADTCAQTFQRLSIRFGNALSYGVSNSTGLSCLTVDNSLKIIDLLLGIKILSRIPFDADGGQPFSGVCVI